MISTSKLFRNPCIEGLGTMFGKYENKKKTKGRVFLIYFLFRSFELKKWHAHKVKHPFASKNHFQLYVFNNSYPNYDKTRTPPITFQGGVFQRVLGVELVYFNQLLSRTKQSYIVNYT